MYGRHSRRASCTRMTSLWSMASHSFAPLLFQRRKISFST
ncbi:hypothetical protein SynWH8103_00105 [Synechococcus sp. WH 8103]|nr:hypothetical protein SynWH8103_00105 [Synechococcus sp. WH 8103]